MKEENIFEYVKDTICSLKQPRPESERKKATSAGDIAELLNIMAEGNKTAFVLLCQIFFHKNGGLRAVLKLDNMNIRGNQIVYAYNYSNKKIDILVLRIKNKDPKMIFAINIESAKRKDKELAVKGKTSLTTFTPKIDDQMQEFLGKQNSLKVTDQFRINL